eukprot:Clim_evm5s149 gene=Clim_evmTU5s149
MADRGFSTGNPYRQLQARGTNADVQGKSTVQANRDRGPTRRSIDLQRRAEAAAEQNKQHREKEQRQFQAAQQASRQRAEDAQAKQQVFNVDEGNSNGRLTRDNSDIIAPKKKSAYDPTKNTPSTTYALRTRPGAVMIPDDRRKSGLQDQLDTPRAVYEDHKDKNKEPAVEWFRQRRHMTLGDPQSVVKYKKTRGVLDPTAEGSTHGPRDSPSTDHTVPGEDECNELVQWRLERGKTVRLALCLCLNIGVDPPDMIRAKDDAHLECWIDPMSMPSQKALEQIGMALEMQYKLWQPQARPRICLDPTLEDVKKACLHLRKNAKSDRILLHYNGHGVPKPSVNGEIWVFNKTYTQYIPLSVYDLQTWMGSPSIYVYDCSDAGTVVEAYENFARQRKVHIEMFQDEQQKRAEVVSKKSKSSREGSGRSVPDAQTPREENPDMSDMAGHVRPVFDTIQLAACQKGETLPINPQLPADLFTSCLTTPIATALRWHAIDVAPRLLPKFTPELSDQIPGKLNDRRTPLGELNWVFTAVTDTIAWTVLDLKTFQRLFRQDLLVASLFRNYLLAERIMKTCGCNPVSSPKIPATANHPMWQAWDHVVDLCIAQLPLMQEEDKKNRDKDKNGKLGSGSSKQKTPQAPHPMAQQTSLPFFEEQLTAFQTWLEAGGHVHSPPMQLPVVLQILLSPVHRLRALQLLARFLDMGAWAVNQSLAVGIFPYVSRLLQSKQRELRPVLVFIWAKILVVDRSCVHDLVKDHGLDYFIDVLNTAEDSTQTQMLAAFILSLVAGEADEHGNSRFDLRRFNLLPTCLNMLVEIVDRPKEELLEKAQLIRWLCLFISTLWDRSDPMRKIGLRNVAHEVLLRLHRHPVPETRTSAIFCLVTYMGISDRSDSVLHTEAAIAFAFANSIEDASPLVRRELAVALSRYTYFNESRMKATILHCDEVDHNRILLQMREVPMPLPRQGSLRHDMMRASEEVPRPYPNERSVSWRSSTRDGDGGRRSEVNSSRHASSGSYEGQSPENKHHGNAYSAVIGGSGVRPRVGGGASSTALKDLAQQILDQDPQTAPNSARDTGPSIALGLSAQGTGSQYVTIWRALETLSMDPVPQVASIAQRCIRRVRAAIARLARVANAPARGLGSTSEDTAVSGANRTSDSNTPRTLNRSNSSHTGIHGLAAATHSQTSGVGAASVVAKRALQSEEKASFLRTGSTTSLTALARSAADYITGQNSNRKASNSTSSRDRGRTESSGSVDDASEHVPSAGADETGNPTVGSISVLTQYLDDPFAVLDDDVSGNHEHEHTATVESDFFKWSVEMIYLPLLLTDGTRRTLSLGDRGDRFTFRIERDLRERQFEEKDQQIRQQRHQRRRFNAALDDIPSREASPSVTPTKRSARRGISRSVSPANGLAQSPQQRNGDVNDQTVSKVLPHHFYNEVFRFPISRQKAILQLDIHPFHLTFYAHLNQIYTGDMRGNVSAWDFQTGSRVQKVTVVPKVTQAMILGRKRQRIQSADSSASVPRDSDGSLKLDHKAGDDNFVGGQRSTQRLSYASMAPTAGNGTPELTCLNLINRHFARPLVVTGFCNGIVSLHDAAQPHLPLVTAWRALHATFDPHATGNATFQDYGTSSHAGLGDHGHSMNVDHGGANAQHHHRHHHVLNGFQFVCDERRGHIAAAGSASHMVIWDASTELMVRSVPVFRGPTRTDAVNLRSTHHGHHHHGLPPTSPLTTHHRDRHISDTSNPFLHHRDPYRSESYHGDHHGPETVVGPNAFTTGNVDVTRMCQLSDLGSVITIGFSDGSLRTYDTRASVREDLIWTVRGEHEAPIIGLAYQPQGSALVTADRSGFVNVWDVRHRTRALEGFRVECSVTCMAMHSTRPMLALGTRDRGVLVHQLNGERLNVIKHHDAYLEQRFGVIRSLAFHPETVTLAVGTGNGIVSLYGVQRKGKA